MTSEDIRQSIEAEGRKIECVQRILEHLSHPRLDLLAIGFQFTDIAAHCRVIYPIEQTYQAADAIVNRIQEAFEFDNLMIVSDHGLAMVPWRGEPFLGYKGLAHRLFGTLICDGRDVERALDEVVTEQRRHLSLRRYRRRELRDLLHSLKWSWQWRTIEHPRYAGACWDLLHSLKWSWQWRRYRGILPLPKIVDITQVYRIVTRTLGVDSQPRILEDVRGYSAEEEQSIRQQLEWLGYL